MTVTHRNVALISIILPVSVPHPLLNTHGVCFQFRQVMAEISLSIHGSVSNNIAEMEVVIDSDIYIFEKRTKLVVADPSERRRWATIGIRRLIRDSKLSQKTVYAVLTGRPVRPQTLSILRQATGKL